MIRTIGHGYTNLYMYIYDTHIYVRPIIYKGWPGATVPGFFRPVRTLSTYDASDPKALFLAAAVSSRPMLNR